MKEPLSEPLKSLVVRTAVREGSYGAAAKALGLPAYKVQEIIHGVGLEGIHSYRPTERPWTEDGIRYALELYQAGWHPEAIAIFFNRPIDQVTRLLASHAATSAAS